jgi:hypothetical protein
MLTNHSRHFSLCRNLLGGEHESVFLTELPRQTFAQLVPIPDDLGEADLALSTLGKRPHSRIAFEGLGVVADPEVGMKLNGTPYTSAYSGSSSPSSSGT